jgi:hypothetical protein
MCMLIHLYPVTYMIVKKGFKCFHGWDPVLVRDKISSLVSSDWITGAILTDPGA